MDAEDRPGAGQRNQRDESDPRDPGDETGRREDGEEDEGGTYENLVQGDGLLEPDPRRNRPLPSPWVRHVFRHLVHEEERRDQEAERDGGEEGFPCERTHLDRIGSEDDDRSEDECDRDLPDSVVLEGEGRERVENPDRSTDPAEYEQDPTVRPDQGEDESNQAPRRIKPDPRPAVGLERDRPIWEDPRASGGRAEEGGRQVIHASPEVDRVVAHVRRGMEARDADRGEDQADRVETPRLAPRDRGSEGHADEGRDEAARLHRLEPGAQRGHPTPRPSGHGEGRGPQ